MELRITLYRELHDPSGVHSDETWPNAWNRSKDECYYFLNNVKGAILKEGIEHLTKTNEKESVTFYVTIKVEWLYKKTITPMTRLHLKHQQQGFRFEPQHMKWEIVKSTPKEIGLIYADDPQLIVRWKNGRKD